MASRTVGSLFALSMCACSDPGVFSQSRIGATLAQLQKVDAAMAAMDGAGAATAICELATSAQGVLTADGPSDSLLAQMPSFNVENFLAPSPDVITCTTASCAFDLSYFALGSYTTFSLRGSIARSGETLTFLVSNGVNRHRARGSGATIRGSLITRADSLGGSIEVEGKTSDNSVSSPDVVLATSDLTLTFVDVRLGPGCVDAGTVTVRAIYDASATTDTNPYPSFELEGSTGIDSTCID